MTTLNAVECTSAWTLVYDATVSGDFTGALQKVSAGHAIGRVTTSATAPAAGASGFILSEEAMPFSVLAANDARLWVRAYTNNIFVTLG